jgi:cytochrome P450
VTTYDDADWFTDQAIAQDPYPYLQHTQSRCPVLATGHHDVIAVTGYEEALEVFRHPETFSACNSTVGPFLTLPEPHDGEDLAGVVQRWRASLPMFQHMVTMDPPEHTQERALLMRLITPKRLGENEDFMVGLADDLLDQFVADGHCEFISQFSQPLATMVIVDLLGVPAQDHQQFREGFGLASTGDLTRPSEYDAHSLAWLDRWFTTYIEERRANPRDDVMSGLAQAKYPDGSTPEVGAVARLATFLFAAGQETSARMLAQAVRFLADDLALQDRLREHPNEITNFIEETLRFESPTKTDSRLALRDTKLGGVDVPAGATVALLLNAINHDPRHFESPDQFRADRPNAREHLAFGRGPHICPGAPLARAEGRISIERLLRRARNIRLSDAHHGPAGNRHFEYEPTWMLRAMEHIHIEFDPVG